MNVRKWPVVGVLLAVLWLFVRGVELTPAALLGEFLIGLGVGLPIAFAVRRMYLPEVDLARNARAIPVATLFAIVFLKEVVVANVDVAYRVIHPRLPIEPDVIELPLRVESDAAITTIANSITLTPGTLTMDRDAETNTLYVHGIIGRRREATIAPIRRFEDLLLVVFDESANPEDEPPERPRETRKPVEKEEEPPRRPAEPRNPGGDDDGR
jgi:multicomponent Na+:H+ antiporter subunit E